jgi:hypothetical protein
MNLNLLVAATLLLISIFSIFLVSFFLFLSLGIDLMIISIHHLNYNENNQLR